MGVIINYNHFWSHCSKLWKATILLLTTIGRGNWCTRKALILASHFTCSGNCTRPNIFFNIRIVIVWNSALHLLLRQNQRQRVSLYNTDFVCMYAALSSPAHLVRTQSLPHVHLHIVRNNHLSCHLHAHLHIVRHNHLSWAPARSPAHSATQWLVMRTCTQCITIIVMRTCTRSCT